MHVIKHIYYVLETMQGDKMYKWDNLPLLMDLSVQ